MTDALLPLTGAFAAFKPRYDQGQNDLPAVGAIAESALRVLQAPGTTTLHQGEAELDGRTKVYDVMQRGNLVSRPIRRDLFISSPDAFAAVWLEILSAARPSEKQLRHSSLDAGVYTAAMSFAVSYDLYRPASRKTPGTFFEVIVGTLLGTVTGMRREKQVTLPDSTYKVPTDILLVGAPAKPILVIATKITTRERVVQPWAHQRILDDAFGRGEYKSVLAIVSELQRDRDRGVNEICLPGQIGLFQRYLAQMYGMYYLDPPASYVSADFAELLPTKPLSALLDTDLRELLDL